MAFSESNYLHEPIPFSPIARLSLSVLAHQDDEFDGRDPMEVFGLPALVQSIHGADIADVPPRPRAIPNEFSSIQEYAEVMQSHVMMEHDAVLKEILELEPRRIDEQFDRLPPSARIALQPHSEENGRFFRAIRPIFAREEAVSISLALNLVRTMPSKKINFVLTHSETSSKSTLTFLKALPEHDSEVYSLEYCGASIASFNACRDLKTSKQLQDSNQGLNIAVMAPRDGNADGCGEWSDIPPEFREGAFDGIGILNPVCRAFP
jgi:hypothetical protein